MFIIKKKNFKCLKDVLTTGHHKNDYIWRHLMFGITRYTQNDDSTRHDRCWLEIVTLLHIGKFMLSSAKSQEIFGYMHLLGGEE